MAEHFANNYSTALDGAIDASQTTFDVLDVGDAPDVNFRIKVENELMLVTGVATLTLTVTRGVEGTTGASHADGVLVTHVLTGEALESFVAVSPGDGPLLVPGLAAHPSKSGLGGGGITEEYDTTTTGLTWSPSTPATVDSNTTVPSHLYAQSSDATERFGYRAWAPGAGALDARMHINSARQATTGAFSTGLLIADAGNTNRVLCQTVDGSSINAFTYTASTYTQRGSTFTSWALGAIGVPVLRITRDAGTTWSFWFSRDGYQWHLIATQSLSFTVAQIGYRMTNGSATTYSFISDYLRTTV